MQYIFKEIVILQREGNWRGGHVGQKKISCECSQSHELKDFMVETGYTVIIFFLKVDKMNLKSCCKNTRRDK